MKAEQSKVCQKRVRRPVVTPGVLLRTQPGLLHGSEIVTLKVKVIVIVNNDEKIDIRDS